MIVWLPVAVRDWDNRIAYITERNVWAAVDIGDAILAAFSRMADFPELGRIGRAPRTRELAVGWSPNLAA
jgi:toxin ParE1/3/4